MKKLLIGLAALIALLLGGFFWLLSQSGPDHAPDTVVTIDLDDSYER